MRTTLLNGTVVALSAVALALVGGTLGLVELWPVLLAAGVGLLLGVPRLPHVLALLGGGAVALFGAWLDLILLPETAAARAGSVALAVVLLTGLSAATRGRLPLAPGLIGWATLTGLLLPQLATDPTGFARIAPVTAAGALLGLSLGLLAAQVAVLLGGAAGRDGVIGRTMSRRRSGGPVALSVVVAAGLFATTTGPAAAAAPAGVEGEVRTVAQHQVVLVTATSDGTFGRTRIVTQVSVTGAGTARVVLEDQAVRRIRTLDAFRGVEVDDRTVTYPFDLRDGAGSLRTVATVERELPFRLDVRYELDGLEVTAADVVGASGRLTVTHTLTNLTAVPTEIRSFDGQGRARTVVRDAAVPLVGALTVALDERFVDVRAPRSVIVGDGGGGTRVETALALFAPLGDIVQQVTWSAEVVDAVIPPVDIRLAPVVVAATPAGAADLDRFEASLAGLRDLSEAGALLTTTITALRPGVRSTAGVGSVLVDQMAQLVTRIVGGASTGVAELNEQRALLAVQDARREAGEGLVHPVLAGADSSTVYIVSVEGRGVDPGPPLPLRIALGVGVVAIVGMLGRSVTNGGVGRTGGTT